ncbi:MAG: thioredoxin [Oscillospiraceae bacterium]|nr:thioredoxin [Oscillospiraceae bacterium]
MAVIEITSANYEEIVAKSEKPVFIDFWAEWCGPCMMLAPIVHELSDERDDIVFCKVNVDNEPTLTAQFGINSIPALFVMRDGKPVKTMVGYMPKADLIAQLEGVV